MIDAHLTCGSRSSAILDRKVLLILLPFTFKLPLSTFSPFCQFNRVSPRTFSLLCLHVWYTRTTFKEEKEVWYGKLHTHLDFSYCCDFYLNLWQLAWTNRKSSQMYLSTRVPTICKLEVFFFEVQNREFYQHISDIFFKIKVALFRLQSSLG